VSNAIRPIRVLIADDHPVLRAGLRSMIEAESGLKVIGNATDGEEAILQHSLLRPDVTLMDLQMPNVDGLVAISAIRAATPDARIVVLTSYRGDARVARAISLGAISYLLKTATASEIASTLRGALLGKRLVGWDIAGEVSVHERAESLSAREVNVLQLVASGNQNRDIGETLAVSEHTVKSRLKNILSKLGARDRTHAVIIAMRRGFIELEPGQQSCPEPRHDTARDRGRKRS
jgi:DNA-binding NarL/FixJ family response regulator